MINYLKKKINNKPPQDTTVNTTRNPFSPVGATKPT